NPDQILHRANISGAYEYRIWGTRGEAAYFSFNTSGASPGLGGEGGRREGHIDHHTLAVNPDGTFEIILSAREHAGNWLRMTPDTDRLMVRQTFLDREKEKPAELQIERLGAEGRPPPVTPEAVAAGLAGAAQFVASIAGR